MNVQNQTYVTIDVEKLWKSIKACGISAGNLATMVLNRDKSYLTTVKTRGTMIEQDLIKLCAFLSIKVEDITIKPPVKEESEPILKNEKTTLNTAPQLELLILGLNQIYEAQKLQNEAINNMLIEIKATSTKINRLENALGQIVTNSIQIKENTGDSRDLLRDIKSTGAIISGRLRDLIGKFK